MESGKTLFDAIEKSDLEMFDKNTTSVPFVVFEGEMTRMERTIKKWFVFCIILFLGLVISNAGWIIYESQFVDEITVTQDTPGGNNNYIGRDGKITNGTANDYEETNP